MKIWLGLLVLVLLVSGCIERESGGIGDFEREQFEQANKVSGEDLKEMAEEEPEPEPEPEPTPEPEPESEPAPEPEGPPAGELKEFILKNENGDSAVGILALKTYNDKLYAADGDGQIFEFSGSEWVQIHKVGGIVYDLEVFEGKLYLDAGIGDISSFDGNVWESVSTEGSSIESTVLDLHTYGDKMYAGCTSPLFSSINSIHFYYNSKWNSFSYPPGIKDNIIAFADYGENSPLYMATGERVYTFQEDFGSDVFPALTDSRPLSTKENDEYEMNTLEGYNGKLFIGTSDNCRLYLYNGRNSVPIDDLECDTVWDLIEYNGKMYATTQPSKLYASETGYSGMWGLIAKLDSSGQALRLEVYDGKLYIGANEGRVYEYNCPTGECATIEDEVYISPGSGTTGGTTGGTEGGTDAGSTVDEGECNETALGINETTVYYDVSFKIMMIDFPSDLLGKAMVLVGVNSNNTFEALTINTQKTIKGIRVTATMIEKLSEEEYRVTLKMCS